MRVLSQGYQRVKTDWHIIETKRVGYSRLYYVTGGCATYTDSWISRKMEPGRLYLLPSEIPFELTHDPENPFCVLYYHFDFFPLMVDRLIEIKVTQPLYHILQSLICHWLDHTIQTRLHQETVWILHNYIIENYKLPHINPKISKCLELIRTQYKSHDFSIESISKTAGYSPEHLNRLFKQYLNTTPYQYAIQLRMTEAVRLLLSGMSVYETSESIGFADTKSFSRAFKKHYGVAPSRYYDYYKDIP